MCFYYLSLLVDDLAALKNAGRRHPCLLSLSRMVGLLVVLAFVCAGTLSAQDTNSGNPTGPSGDFNGESTTGGSYDPFTHNAKRRVTDLTVLSYNGAYPLAFSRTYNSQYVPVGNDVSYFGDGSNWRHSYQWTVAPYAYSATPNVPGAYSVAYPDGAVIVFRPDRGSKPLTELPTYWRGPSGTKDRLEVQSTTNLTLHMSDGGTVVFGNQVHPSSIVDPYGATTVLTYSTANPGYLDTVTEPGGRWLLFNYQTVVYKGQDINGRATKFNYTMLIRIASCRGTRTSPVIDQSVSYNCVAYGTDYHGTGNYTSPYYVLVGAVYNNEVSTGGGNVQAGYSYAADPNDTTVPLLTGAVDPHYAGAMTNIAYAYSSVYGDIKGEQSLQTGEFVTSFDVGTMTETRGDKAAGGAAIKRGFKYGEASTNGFSPTNATPSMATTRTDFEGNAAYLMYWSRNDKDSNGQGYLESSMDHQRNITSYGHEPLTGKTTSVKLPDGRTHSWKWFGRDGQDTTQPYYLFQSTDERGQVTNYQRAGNTGLILAITYPQDGGQVTYDYQGFGYNGHGFYKVRVITDQRGAQTVYGYDETDENHGGSGYLGLLTSVQRGYNDGYGNVKGERIRFFYDQMDRLVESIDPRGVAEKYDYDGRHQIVQVTHLTDPTNTNPFVGYTYDDYGNLLTVRDELGHVTVINYDIYRRVTSMVVPVNDGVSSNRFVSYGYDRRDNGNNSIGTATSQTDSSWSVSAQPSSKAVQHIFSPNGWLTDEYNGMSVDGSGMPHPGPGFMHVSHQYDSNGYVNKIIDAQGQTWTVTSRDSCGRPRTFCDPLAASIPNHAINWAYYGVSDTDQNGMKSAGLLASVTFPQADLALPMAVSSSTKHDTMGRTLQSVDAYSHTFNSTFNPAGDLISQNEGGPEQGQGQHVTGYLRDQLGRKIKLSYPDGSFETWTYDVSGNVAIYNNRVGAQKTFNYDSRNRLISSTWSNNAGYWTGYAYDTASRLLEVQNPIADIRYQYNDTDEVMWESEQPSNQSAALKTNYTRDMDGNVTMITYPNGNTPSFEYDNQQRPTCMYSGGTGAGRVNFSLYTYYGSWLAGRWIYPDVYTSYDFQLNGRMSDVWHYHGSSSGNHLNNASISRHAYGYMPDGRISWYDREADGGQSGSKLENGRGDAYYYYADGSLGIVARDVAAKGGWPQAFKNADSRVDGGNVDYSNGNANTYSNTFKYDADGNRKGQTTVMGSTYTYNADGTNRYPIMGYGDGNGNTTYTATGWNCNYDADNNLRNAAGPGGATIGFDYDGLGRLIAQVNNGVYSLFYYAGTQRIEERGSNNALQKLYFFEAPGSDALLFSQDNTWGRLWYLRDLTGSTTQLLSEDANAQGLAGTVVEVYLYDAWGTPTVYDGQGNARAGNVSKYDNRYLWHGASAYEWLSQAQFYYARARFYLPTHGRWLQPDPIGQAGGLNIYAYCGNDPVNGDDPSGLVTYDEAQQGVKYTFRGDDGLQYTGFKDSQNAWHDLSGGGSDNLDRVVIHVPGDSADLSHADGATGDTSTFGTYLGEALGDAGRASSGVDRGVRSSVESVIHPIKTVQSMGEVAGQVYYDPSGTASAVKANAVDTFSNPDKVSSALGNVSGGLFAGAALPGGLGKGMTADQIALKELVKEVSSNGTRTLSVADAEAILKWGQEVKYPGLRASANDLASPSNWKANPVPHIHINGVASGHIPVVPGVQPIP